MPSNLSVRSLSTATPPHTMTQGQALELAESVLRPSDAQARVLRALYRRSGVDSRRLVVPYELGREWAAMGNGSGGGASTRTRMKVYEECAGPLAAEAAAQALRAAGDNASEITHLVTVSCTGFQAPGVAAHLIQQLGLNSSTQCVNVGFMGCHGAVNGLRTAQALASGHPEGRVLMCAVELCSLHYSFGWDPERLVSNALFADGAAALVGSSDGTPGSRLEVLATGSHLFPDTGGEMSWLVGDHGFEMTLSSKVPDLIGKQLPAWLDSWLMEHGASLAEIDHWAVHPGGPRIVSAVEETLDLASDQVRASREVLAERGNMSSPTVLYILQRMLQSEHTGLCVILAFGPGLVVEAALVRLNGDDA